MRFPSARAPDGCLCFLDRFLVSTSKCFRIECTVGLEFWFFRSGFRVGDD